MEFIRTFFSKILLPAFKRRVDAPVRIPAALGKRTHDVEAREQRQKKATEEAMTPVEREAKQADDKKASEKAADADKPPARKPPTLLRPGEKKQDPKN